MKANLVRAALIEKLSLVASIVPSRTPKPILKSLRISAEKNSIQLCATDLEVGINCQFSQVEIKQPGEVIIPADRFLAIVRESADEVISLESADTTCHIRGSDSHFTILCHEPSQYPHVPGDEGKAELEILLTSLQEGIEQSVFAAARESSRYAINGVLWDLKSKKLLLVATDGRRLAQCKVDILSAASDKIASQRIIVPTKTMTILQRITAGSKDKIGVHLEDNRMILSCPDLVVSSNLIEGNFPKYEDILPKDYDKKLHLNTQATLSAVRRAALLTNEDSNGVRIAIEKDSLVFTSRAPEAGDAEINMTVDYKGEPIQIAFNPQFLVDALRVIRTDEFELELGQPDRPGLIKSGTNFLYVLMPINLS